MSEEIIGLIKLFLQEYGSEILSIYKLVFVLYGIYCVIMMVATIEIKKGKKKND